MTHLIVRLTYLGISDYIVIPEEALDNVADRLPKGWELTLVSEPTA
jgi:hypothetical protein